jgi:hypothetical protein
MKHVSKPLWRLIRIQRQVSRAGFQNRQQANDHPNRAGQGNCYHRFRTDPLANPVVSQPVSSEIKLSIVFARTLLPETEDTIIAEEVKKFPARKWRRWVVVSCGQLRKDEELRIRKRVQIIVEVEVEAGAYASEQYQSRVSAPGVCPNCGIARSLEAHGYYWRWVTEAVCGRVLRIAVRRFLPAADQTEQ